MNVIEHTYESLLVDVSRKCKYSEIRGLMFDTSWCLNEAPQLEKNMISMLEQYPNLLTDNGIDWLSYESEDHIFLKSFRQLIERTPRELRRLMRDCLRGSPFHIRLMRQLLLFYYKACITHESATTEIAYSNYHSCQRDVKEGTWKIQASSDLVAAVKKHVQSVLFGCKFEEFSPSHGPGASTSPKWRWEKVYRSIDEVFPYYPYYCVNYDSMIEMPDYTDSEIECKVVAVPKDSRGPRLVCVHPAEAIWAQQGVRRVLERGISRRRKWYPSWSWPCGHIRFDDQSVNGRIALLSSRSRRYATLDLKEASDRLSVDLIEHLFGRYYKFFGCSRARSYRIGNATYPMYSYAPMGNATVFPVQSLVFWAICVASMHRQGSKAPGAAFVFGDDIIVPVQYAHGVIKDLEAFGLVVNRQKSFSNGYFRESCGVDAFKGIDVTPIRWKQSVNPTDIPSLVALCDTAMSLRLGGYHESASCIYSYVRHTLKRRYGIKLYFTCNRNHGGLAEYTETFTEWYACAYWHKDIQRWVTPIWRAKAVDILGNSCGWNHVLSSLLSLERSGRATTLGECVSRRIRPIREWSETLI